MKNLLFLLFAVSFSVACLPGNYGWNCVEPQGRVESRNIDVRSFTGVSASGSHKVQLVRGSQNALVVEGHPNHLDLLDVEVKNGTLQLGFDKCLEDAQITFTITTPRLDALSNSGSGMVWSDDRFRSDRLKISNSGSGRVNLRVDADELRVDNSGSGRVELAGSGDRLTINNSGSGRIHLGDYHVRTARMAFSGSGRGEISVSEEISGAVSGSGGLLHHGNARTNVAVSGSGGLERSN